MDWRYVSKGDMAKYGGKKRRMKAWSKSGSTGKFVRSFPVAARVNNVVFVHAGIRSQFAKRGLEDLIKKMKTVTAKIGVDVIKQPTSLASANRCLAKPHSEKYVLVRSNKHPELVGDEGPVWTRLFAGPDSNSMCAEVKKVLRPAANV